MLQITINEDGTPSFKFTRPIAPKELANLFYTLSKTDFSKSFAEAVTPTLSDQVNLSVTNYLVDLFQEDENEINQTYLELLKTPIDVNSKKSIR
jgi:hypothetical protein